MSYSIELSDNFKREAKRLTKKYPSLKSELAALFEQLAENPTMGTPLGNEVYKSALEFHPKTKGNQAVQEFCPLLKLCKQPFCFLAFTAKEKLTTYLIKL